MRCVGSCARIRKLFSFQSLRTRLTISILLVTFPVILTAVLALGSLSANLVQSSARQRLAVDNVSSASAIERWDHYFVLALENVRGQPGIIGMNPADQRPIVQHMKTTYDHIDIVRVTRPDGMSVVRSDSGAPIYYRDRQWFQACMAGQPVARQVLMSRTSNCPALNVSTPIYDVKGKVVGVLSAITYLSSISHLPDISRSPPFEQTFVVDEFGRALAHPDLKTATALCDLSTYPPVRDALAGNDGASAFSDSAAVAWFAHTTRIANGWYVITQVPVTTVSSRGAAVMRTTYSVAAATLTLVALFTWLLARRLLRPIGQLTSAANDLAHGDFSRRVPQDRRDELGRLAGAFNTMASQLEKRTAELQRTNQALQSAMTAADAANLAKSQFLANMSHEIRTPITAILGFSDMMLDHGQTQSDRLDNLQIIRRNARHLLELINDILDLSKIEAGEMVLQPVACDLPELLNDLVSMMQPRALEKSLQLCLSAVTPVPKNIHTDPLRLRQILVNLLSNAIKFSESGRVELSVAAAPADASTHLVKFAVADRGIGMTAQQIDGLFQPFRQADGSTTRRFGGTGLGLTICKRFVEMLGGKISIQSRPGAGTTVSFTISAPAQSAQTVTDLHHLADLHSATHQPLPVVRGKIHLAEDGLDNQRLIAAILRKAGAELDIADNGKIALDMALHGSYDLIFMDMQMPEMDGYQTATELRRRGCFIPIIALTAHALADDKAKCLAAGCTAYLSKPIDRHKLLATAAKTISTFAAPQPTPAADPLISDFATDPDMVQLLSEFIAALPEKVSTIRRLMDEQNIQELCEAVHQLKGTGSSYGFSTLTAVASAAEALLCAGQPIDAAQQQIDALLELIRRIRGYESAKEAPVHSPSPGTPGEGQG